MSDFDFGVLLCDETDYFVPSRRNEIYDTLYAILSAKINMLKNIDIVFLEQMPLELKQHTVLYGIPLYEAGIHVFARFRERVMDMYADFAPLRGLFHKAILGRIKND